MPKWSNFPQLSPFQSPSFTGDVSLFNMQTLSRKLWVLFEKSSSLMVDLMAGLISMETLWCAWNAWLYHWSPWHIVTRFSVASFKIPIWFAEHEDRNSWQHYATLKLPRTGQEEWQHAFTEAPKNWCSFVLNHLVRSLERTPRLMKFSEDKFYHTYTTHTTEVTGIMLDTWWQCCPPFIDGPLVHVKVENKWNCPFSSFL